MSAYIKKADIIIIICVAAAALCSFALLFISASDGETVAVSVDGTKTEYPLDEDMTFEVENNGYTLVIEIKDGAVAVKESDCPDKICINTGKISKSGRIIACVPAGVTVRITGGDSDVDIVAG